MKECGSNELNYLKKEERFNKIKKEGTNWVAWKINSVKLLLSRRGEPNLLHFRTEVGDSRDADNNLQNRSGLLARLRLHPCHGQLHGTTILPWKWNRSVQSKQSVLPVRVQRLHKYGGMSLLVRDFQGNTQRLHVLLEILLFWGKLQRQQNCKQWWVVL